jgi:hypothetical protein
VAANDSSTGGYLQPTGTPPPEDAVLDAIFQQMIVGLTGLPGNMVRPRWQPTVPKQPEPNVNWCAVGMMDIEPDANPYEQQNADGSYSFIRHEILPVLCSFYGPTAMSYAAQARDGIYVSQNNAMLDQHEMGLVEASRITPAPALINQQWVRRFDLTIRIRRRVVRTYQILTVLSAQATAKSETQTEPINVTQ